MLVSEIYVAFGMFLVLPPFIVNNYNVIHCVTVLKDGGGTCLLKDTTGELVGRGHETSLFRGTRDPVE